MVPRNHLVVVAGAAAMSVFSAVLYLLTIDRTPPAAARATVTAEAGAVVAQRGRDVDGRTFPMVWHGRSGGWYSPVPVYASAVCAGLVGLDIGPRIAASAFGALGVGLFFAIIYHTFGILPLAVAATLLFALTPAYATFSRTASHDGVWLVPFAETWLLGLAIALDRPRSAAAMLVCAAAAAGCVYAQPTGALTALLLSGVTIRTLRRRAAWTPRTMAVSLTASAIVLLPLALWLARYPSAYAGAFAGWLLHPAHIRNPIVWARALSNFTTLSVVSQAYWDFFSPSHLLLSDTAPALAGVFALPVVVFVAAGVRDAFKADEEHVIRRLVCRGALAVFLSAPLIAATFNEIRAIDRSLIVVPFALVLAANGMYVMWSSGRSSRAALALAFAGAVAQSAVWFRG